MLEYWGGHGVNFTRRKNEPGPLMFCTLFMIVVRHSLSTSFQNKDFTVQILDFLC